MRSLRRAPREVYRVYDEARFLAEAPRELTGTAERRVPAAAVVGMMALLLGAAGAFGGLLASAKRQPKGEARRRAASSGSNIRSIARPARVAVRPQRRRPAARSLAHRRRTHLARGGKVSRTADVRSQVPHVFAGGSVTTPASAEVPIAVSAPRHYVGSSGEFGFER